MMNCDLLAILAILLCTCGCTRAIEPSAPKPTSSETLLAKIHCVEQGWKYIERQTRESKKYALPKSQTETNPEFAYSRKLNTCFCEHGFLDLSDGGQSRFLVDVLTNKTVAQYFSNSAKRTLQDHTNVEAYEAKKRELLAE